MSTPIDDGGPAFTASPFIGPDGVLYGPADIGCDGMSLRDWFAGQALGHIPELLKACELNRSVSMIANWSYQVADAMLAARKQKADQ